MQAFEQHLVRAGEERLQPQGLDLVEQGGAAARVEVGGDFVQEEDRRGTIGASEAPVLVGPTATIRQVSGGALV